MSGRPDLAGWPVNLLVRGRRVVVVGAGRVATRKIGALLDLGADVVVIDPRPGAQTEEWSATGRLRLHRRRFTPADLDGAWLAVAATDDPAVSAAAADAAEERHVWLNAADDPARCSFTLLSVVRRGDVVVAAGTGGRSPALARWLRRRLEEEIGPEYEVLVDLLGEMREELQAAGSPTEDADWQRALDAGILVLVREGRMAEAKELLRSCL